MVASHCLSTDGASASPRSCLPLSPSVSPHVSLCWTLASHGLRTSVPVLDGVSVFPRFVSPCLHLFRYMYAGCWMVCPPSRGLVSPSLRLCSIVSHMCACVRCCVRLPEVLSPTVFPHMRACVGWCVRLSPLVSLCFPHIVAHVSLRWKVCYFPEVSSPHCLPIYIYIHLPLSPTVSQCLPLLSLSPHCSHCLPTCVPVDGGLAFLRRACVGWCVHIPELLSRLVSQLVSHVSPHVCLWRMMRPPFRGLVPPCLPVLDAVSVFPRSCPPLCPFLFPYLGWCVRVSEALSPFLFSFVGWCVCLPEVLSSLVPPLFPIVFPHVCPTCVPVLCDRLPEVLPPLVSFFLHMCACVGWCVSLPEVLPPLVSHSLPFCVPVFGWYDPLSPIVRLRWISEVLPPLVSHCLPTSAPVLDGVSAFPRSCLAWSSFLCPFVGWYARFPVLSPLVSYVSHCLQLSVIVSPHVSPPSRGLVSPCVPSCFPLLDGASAVPLLWIISHCLPFCFPLLDGVPSRGLVPLVPQLVSQLVSQLARLSFPLVSAFQLVFLLVSVSWMVRASSRGLVSQLVSQLVFVLVSLCWVVCPSSPLSPTSPFFFPFVGWFVRLPKSLSRLSPSLCTSLSSFLFPFVGGCVHLPTVLSLLSPSLSSSLFPSLPRACLPACLPACLSLVPQQKFSHAENCADLKVHRAPGLKMMCHLSLSSFDVFNTSNLTVLCCLLRAFGTKYLHPHRMLPSSFFGI